MLLARYGHCNICKSLPFFSLYHRELSGPTAFYKLSRNLHVTFLSGAHSFLSTSDRPLGHFRHRSQVSHTLFGPLGRLQSSVSVIVGSKFTVHFTRYSRAQLCLLAILPRPRILSAFPLDFIVLLQRQNVELFDSKRQHQHCESLTCIQRVLYGTHGAFPLIRDPPYSTMVSKGG